MEIVAIDDVVLESSGKIDEYGRVICNYNFFLTQDEKEY
jgi:hypothetical protein